MKWVLYILWGGHKTSAARILSRSSHSQRYRCGRFYRCCHQRFIVCIRLQKMTFKLHRAAQQWCEFSRKASTKKKKQTKKIIWCGKAEILCSSELLSLSVHMIAAKEPKIRSLKTQLNWQHLAMTTTSSKIHSFVCCMWTTIFHNGHIFIVFTQTKLLIFIFETNIFVAVEKTVSEIHRTMGTFEEEKDEKKKQEWAKEDDDNNEKGIRNRTDLNVKSDMNLEQCVCACLMWSHVSNLFSVLLPHPDFIFHIVYFKSSTQKRV